MHDSDGFYSEQWLSSAEAAARLGISVRTLQRYTKQGRLASSRLPSGVSRFRRSDVEALLQPVEADGARSDQVPA